MCIVLCCQGDVAEIIFLQLGMDWALAEKKVKKMVLGALGMAFFHAGENHVLIGFKHVFFRLERILKQTVFFLFLRVDMLLLFVLGGERLPGD